MLEICEKMKQNIYYAIMSSIILGILTIYLSFFQANAQEAPPAAADAGQGGSVPEDLGDAAMTSVLPDIAQDKQVICDAIKTPDAEMKIDVTGPMEYDDILRLTVWNNFHNLRSGKKTFEFPEIQWKRAVLTKLVNMFSTGCGPGVPNAFLSITKELFMIYMNSLNGTEDHSQAWQPFLGVLDLCQSKNTLLETETNHMLISNLKVTTKEGGQETLGILIPEELADRALNEMDLIIDSIWWFFSFSFGNCFWIPEQPTIWASRYKRLFYLDFLNDLRERWMSTGPTDYGVIYGDMQLSVIRHNIRACVTAAYLKNGIADRQLVRSLMIDDTNVGMEARLNRKIGTTLNEI